MGRAKQRHRLAREARASATIADAVPEGTPRTRAWYSAAARVVASPWFLAVVLVLAAVLRAAHVLALKKTPLFDHLQLDHRAYDEWAQEIARGNWLGTKVFFVDPLYAYFLGALYGVFGHDLLAVRLVQAALGVGTCALCAVLARRVLGSAALGNAAALIVALFVPAIFYEAAIEKTGLALFLFTLALVLFFVDSRAAVATSGVVLGLAILARGNYLLLLPAGFLALLLGRGAGAMGGKRRVATRALLFLAGAVVVLGVAIVRNWIVGRELLITSNLGQNLYLGHHPSPVTAALPYPDFVRPDTRYEESDFKAEAERRLGRTLLPGEVSGYWFGQAVAEIATDPGGFLGRTAHKIWLFWSDHEVPDNENLAVVADWSPVLRLPVVRMGQIAPFALLGAVLWWRRSSKVRLLAGAVLVYFAGVVVFFVLGKLRVQVVSMLAVLAAAGVGALAEAARENRSGRLKLGIAVLLGGALVSNLRPGWIATQHRSSVAISFNNLGTLLLDAGDTDSAIHAYERAIEMSPDSVIGAMRTLGDVYLSRRDYGSAERQMRRVLELRPGSRAGREALVRLYEGMASDERYRDDPEVRAKLAEAHRVAGRADEAKGGEEGPADEVKSAEESSMSMLPGAALLGDEELRSLVQTLGKEPSGTPVWFAVLESDPSARELAGVLADAFTRVGWEIRGRSAISFGFKTAVAVFAADEKPARYVATAKDALEKAGLPVTFGTGYRAFSAEMKRTRPGWQGVDLAPEQTYVIVVGRQEPRRPAS